MSCRIKLSITTLLLVTACGSTHTSHMQGGGAQSAGGTVQAGSGGSRSTGGSADEIASGGAQSADAAQMSSNDDSAVTDGTDTGTDAGIQDVSTPVCPDAQGSAKTECVRHEDCGSHQRCVCFGSYLACRNTDCLSDADCGNGLHCKLEPQTTWIYHCTTADDECQETADCDAGICHFSSSAAHWVCELVAPPIP